MHRDVRNGDAFICINRQLTSMKILHAEYGGLVICNMKLERICIGLPSMQLDESASPERLTEWQELVMMTRGISPVGARSKPRWMPSKILKASKETV